MGRVFLCLWFASISGGLGVVVVYALREEFVVVRREVRDGMYPAAAYVAAHTLLQVPLMVALSLAVLGVPAYAIANFHAPKFATLLLAYSAQLWAFECIAQLISVAVGDALVGCLVHIGAWFSSFLYSGIILAEDQIVWPFRLLVFASPVRWGVSAMIHAEFVDAPPFAGTKACGSGGAGGASNATSAAADSRCARDGFYCPGDRTGGLECFGRDGADVLASLHVSYPAIDPRDHVARDVGANLAIALACKLVFVAVFAAKCRAAKPPQPR